MKFLSALAVSLLALAPSALAAAGVPYLLGHQGRLLGTNDTPISATVPMTFQIQETDNPAVIDPKWTETRDVTVSNGAYGVVLGDTRPGANGVALPPELLAKTELYLSVKVDGKELLPRLRLSSTMYALRAARAGDAENVLANGVDTAAIKDAAVTTEKLKDGSVTLAKLAVSSGKFVGLDADTLDGLDSAQFAPAGIVDTIGAPPSGSSIAKEIGSIRTTGEGTAAALAATDTKLATAIDDTKAAVTALAATVGTTASNSVAARFTSAASDVAALSARVGAPAGASVAADVAALSGRVGAPAGASVAADVAALSARIGAPTAASLAADVAALAATVNSLSTFVRARAGTYTITCADFASKGWADEDTCLQDGRWHRYFQLNPGTVNSSSTINATKFHAAAVNGADTKARLGYDWFNFTIRPTNGPNAWYGFSTDTPRPLHFYVDSAVSGTPSIQVWVWNSTTTGSSSGTAIRDNGPNKHWVSDGYTGYTLNATNMQGPSEFWAKY